MMARTLHQAIFIILGGALCASVIAMSGSFIAHAQEDTIVYPVAELGNCENKSACKQYCAGTEHIEACIAFAEVHGLMKKEEAEVAKKFAHSMQENGGPGGCSDVGSCRAYCENIEHIEECLAFAEANGHSDSDVEEGKKVAAFLKSGGTLPGGCTSRQSCEAYCSEADHMDECIAFAERAGLEMHEPDGRPLSIEQMKKVRDLMKNGETPGACRSREQCESYCEDPEHAEQCLAFAERAGFMPKEEIERARTMMRDGGPGGCRGRAQCEEFCRNPENQEACMQFAVEHGMMPPQDMERMKEMRRQFEEHGMGGGAHGDEQHAGGGEEVSGHGQGGGPPGIGDCVREKMTQIIASGGMPNEGVAQDMVRDCMEQSGYKGGGPPGASQPRHEGEFDGKGDCGSEEECKKMFEHGPNTNGPRDGMQYQQQFNDEMRKQMEKRMQEEYQKHLQGQGDQNHPPPPPQGSEPQQPPPEGNPPPPPNEPPPPPPPPPQNEQQPLPPPPPPAPQTNSQKFNAMVASALTALFALYGAR